MAESDLDRERLKEVRQTDLTEGRINEDFVDWLKTKGMTWLLVIVIALFAYAAFVRWNSHRLNYRTEAWNELNRDQLPSSLEDVADKYSDVDAVPHLARLRAAGQLMFAVQTGKAIAPPGETPVALTETERTDYLERADGLFARVAKDDDGSTGRALIAAVAINGRAAVAESRHNLDQAREFYEQAAKRVESLFPSLAEQTRSRAAKLGEFTAVVQLPTQAEITTAQRNLTQQPPLDPVWSETWMTELLTPES